MSTTGLGLRRFGLDEARIAGGSGGSSRRWAVRNQSGHWSPAQRRAWSKSDPRRRPSSEGQSI